MNSQSNSLPTVSIIIPFRNEEKFISKCLDSVINNTYPHELIEILLIDGMSEDNSSRIIEKYQEKYKFIKLLKNPKRIFPSAVNIGIENSKNEIIIILGAHAEYDKNYIKYSVEGLEKYNADNVGGILITHGQNEGFIGKIISSVLSNPFGVGNSKFRTGSEEPCETDTVFGGCYKKEIFKKIGLFIEDLVSSSDIEFNSRLKRNGGKIWLDPKIVANYYTRSTLKKFIKNNYRNGFWAIYPIRFVSYIPIKLRHAIPLLFFIGLLTLIGLVFVSEVFLYLLLGVLIVYFSTSLIFALKYSNLKYAFFMPFFFFLLHITYGIGSFIALLTILIKGKERSTIKYLVST